MAALRLAVLPSNQAYNAWIEQGKRTNEQEQMALFARRLAGVARDYPALEAQVLPGEAETDTRPGTFPELKAQQLRAKAWLDQAPPGVLTVALNFHTDSGGSHVAYCYRVDKPAWISSRFGYALARRLRDRFWSPTTPLLGLDYSSYRFARDIGKHTPVLLELGSHQVPSDNAILREMGFLVARLIVEETLRFFGLPTTRRSELPKGISHNSLVKDSNPPE